MTGSVVINATGGGGSGAAAGSNGTDPLSGGDQFSRVYNSMYPMNFDPDYVTLFDFEKFEEHESWRQWMYSHWHWSIYASMIYVAVVFAGQAIMRNREPFKIRRILTFWNVALALFSAAGFLRSIPELALSAAQSPHRSVCYL